MTELQIVERLRSRFGVTGRGVVLGIGDDCAIFRPVGSPQDLVFTTDQMIEGSHFHPGARPSWIGEKALARALSDIAAMAADPRFCLVSLAVPRSFDLDAFYRGLGRIADRFSILVAGGDLARSRSVSCDVVVCGSVPRGRALRRDRARPGDAIYVSGPLGQSALRKYRNIPEPRIAWGRNLRGRATAGMDLSDGLSLDLHRLCDASSVGASLFNVPVASGATLEQALHGGEDYELLYTGQKLPGLEIGVITHGPSGSVTFNGSPLAPGGWDHFA
jgi:thiamine-monophosphate kinase